MKLGAKIFGALSGILLLYLLVGLILPGTWEAEVEATLPAPPETVFPYLSQVDLWLEWNPIPASGMESTGPSAGVGAGLEWNDPQYGSGHMTILESRKNEGVVYAVQIEGGRLQIEGTLSLSPQGTGSRLVWRERGDFGWNPLMGYAARGMAGSQGEAMRANLDSLTVRLREESTARR
jgi:uncharacterized protein YndB with AHSA1/START domain